LVLAKFIPQAEHIARISLADLVLDTWPCNAHTTCSDALRAGVPVLTFPGQTFASRVAASILTTGNLSEWIADSPEQYVQKAVAFANQPRAAITAMKQKLHETYWSSPMVDNVSFAHQFESLCLGLYDRHAAGNPPIHLQLDADGSLHSLSFSSEGSISQCKQNMKQETSESKDLALASENFLQAGEPFIQKISPQVRAENLRRFQDKIVGLEKPPVVLGRASTVLDGNTNFGWLADNGLVELIELAPISTLENDLKKNNKPHRSYEQVALGKGLDEPIYVCSLPEMSSVLIPDENCLRIFPKFLDWGNVVETRTVKTTRLDDANVPSVLAMISFDTQIDIMQVLKNSTCHLSKASIIQLKLAPIPLYQGAASLFEIGQWLEQQGWVLHTFFNLQKRLLKPFGTDSSPYQGRNHLLQVDAIFVPDLRKWTKLSSTRLESLAFLTHALYQSYDLSARALWTLDQRDGKKRTEIYEQYLKEAGFNA